jgi:TolA-binding protein
MKINSLFCALALLLPLMGTASAQQSSRALQNYRSILSGQKKIEQLSADERKEVLAIMRVMQSLARSSGKSPMCRDAIEQAESAADDLESAAGRLRSCAANRDFDDDCSSEYSRVRNAHDDYESAVSDIQSYCR